MNFIKYHLKDWSIKRQAITRINGIVRAASDANVAFSYRHGTGTLLMRTSFLTMNSGMIHKLETLTDDVAERIAQVKSETRRTLTELHQEYTNTEEPL